MSTQPHNGLVSIEIQNFTSGQQKSIVINLFTVLWVFHSLASEQQTTSAWSFDFIQLSDF